jgi:hypothetical protein
MRCRMTSALLFMLILIFAACNKDKKPNGCADGATVRQIINKRAVVKVTALIHPVYLIEEGAIDTKLVPCNFPPEFYQGDLEVVISGEVKATSQPAGAHCCFENFVITKISR